MFSPVIPHPFTGFQIVKWFPSKEKSRRRHLPDPPLWLPVLAHTISPGSPWDTFQSPVKLLTSEVIFEINMWFLDTSESPRRLRRVGLLVPSQKFIPGDAAGSPYGTCVWRCGWCVFGYIPLRSPTVYPDPVCSWPAPSAPPCPILSLCINVHYSWLSSWITVVEGLLFLS